MISPKRSWKREQVEIAVAVFYGECNASHFPHGIRHSPRRWNTYGRVFAERNNVRFRVNNGSMPADGGWPQGKRDTINAWVLRGAPQ